MLVVTTENVPHHRVVEVKGQCFGVVVRSRGLGGNIMAGLRSIVGGEIHEYTALLERSPKTYMQDLRAPMLVIQGANDPRVVEAESRDVVKWGVLSVVLGVATWLLAPLLLPSALPPDFPTVPGFVNHSCGVTK